MNTFHQLMISRSDEEFEKILTNPILDIAARFWDAERYEAFKICYRSMREIDDLVDHRKASGNPLTQTELAEFRNRIKEKMETLADPQASGELAQTLTRFQIPSWPWLRLSEAMDYDLEHNGFSTFQVFLRYCEGAAIAPAAVFVHLCGVKKEREEFCAPEFDIRKCARDLALFSYLVHILRDFEKDQKRNLNYFSDDILQKCGLNKIELNELVRSKTIDDRIWRLFEEYKRIAGYYQKQAQKTFEYLLPQLAPKYQLSLNVIFALYSHLYEKIDPQNQSYAETDLNLSPGEVRLRLNMTVESFRPV